MRKLGARKLTLMKSTLVKLASGKVTESQVTLCEFAVLQPGESEGAGGFAVSVVKTAVTER
ncbi:MAG: hypothetical protein JJ952_06855 [Pseudomonadales bacterium]|nr:hypothetical protein [Pseudomonadales bacterium]